MKFFVLFSALILCIAAPAQAQEALLAVPHASEKAASDTPGFVPPYQKALDEFNAKTDEELLADILPQKEPPPAEELNGTPEEETLEPPALFNDTTAPAEDAQTSSLPTDEDEKLALYRQLPQFLLDDAQDFYETCQGDYNMSAHYECRCMAKAYLDKAIQVGPDYSRTGIVASLQNVCPNTVEMAGMAYQQCLSQGFFTPGNKSMEDYCSCFGNEYARAMTGNQARMGSRKIAAARLQAIEACRD